MLHCRSRGFRKWWYRPQAQNDPPGNYPNPFRWDFPFEDSKKKHPAIDDPKIGKPRDSPKGDSHRFTGFDHL